MLPPPAPVVVVQADGGGVTTAFAARVAEYKRKGVSVRIEGQCLSACTMVTALPASRICVGPAAELGFHQAYLPNRFNPLDTSIRAEDGTALLMRHYPQRLRAWIARMGGLTADLITLKGPELRSLFRTCR